MRTTVFLLGVSAVLLVVTLAIAVADRTLAHWMTVVVFVLLTWSNVLRLRQLRTDNGSGD